MKLSSKESPWARENRPLPHEIEEFLIEMVYWQVDNDPHSVTQNAKKVTDWLEACSR